MKRPQITMNDANSSLTPKLRFPEFQGTEAWAIESLGEVCDVLNNRRRPIAGDQRVPGPYPYYGASGIVDYVGDFIFDERLLLVGEDGAKWESFEKTAFIVEGKYWVNNHAHVLKPIGINDGLLENYLTMANLGPFVTGAAPPKLTLGKLKGIPVPVPKSQAEQQKIAECLSSLDTLIGAESQKLDALKAHKKGLIQQLFPREGETLPRLRFPEFQKAEGWTKRTLGQAATFYNGRAYKQEELLESGKYPVLRVGNFFTSNTWYYSDLELDETKYCKEGDLLYAWSASFGPRIWRGERSIYHYHIWKVIEHRGIDKQFLFITLENETENMKAKTTNGLGIMHITKGAIESWESAFPMLAEQREIAGCLSSIDSTITSQIKKLDTLKIHKHGLMQQLFPTPDAI